MADGPLVRYRSIVADSGRWEGFGFRPGDIVISTPPKCGTTWTQMVCALLIFQTPSFDRSLDLISPWLDMLTRDREAVVADLEAQRHRRFIKTHTPFDGLPDDPDVTYICVARDPRDVGLSWGNHMANLDFPAFFLARQAAVGLVDLAELMPDGPPVLPESEVEGFWRWVDDPSPPAEAAHGSLWGTFHHLDTFFRCRAASPRGRQNVILLHFDQLKADLEGQMRRLAGRLGIEVPEDRWPELVQAATFEQMRRRADEVVPDSTHRVWRDNRRFFNRGTSGQWRELLDESGLRRYEARVRQIAGPELSDWAHQGPILG